MNKENYKLQLGSGSLSFNFEGLRVGSMKPSVNIKTGSEEMPVSLTFTDAPSVKTAAVNTFAGPAKETQYIWNGSDYRFTWSIAELDTVNGFTLKCCFYNRSDKPIRLTDFVLGQTDESGIACDGDSAKWLLSTMVQEPRIGNMKEVLPSINEITKSIWEGFAMPVPHKLSEDEKFTDGRWRIYKDFLTLYGEGYNSGLFIGSVGKPEADIRYDCKVDNGKMSLSIVSEMTDVLVEPGQRRSSQEVCVMCEPYEFAANTILRWVASTHGQRTHRGPVIGWCSWYDLQMDVSEKSVMDTTDKFIELKDRLKIDVIQIDGGFEKQVGDWRANDKFTDGFSDVIEAMRKAGAMPGIWMAPQAVHSSTGIIDKHPDWFQKDARGDILGEANNWGPISRWLDPTHPGAQEFMREAVRTKREEGFTYFKIDFNTIDSECRLHNPYKTRLQAYRDLYKLYREEMREDAYLLSCSGFLRGTMGYADASRIGPDSCNAWKAPHPCCISECIRALGQSAIANGVFYANDPDVTYLKSGRDNESVAGDTSVSGCSRLLTSDETRTWHSFVGLLGGLALISDPISEPFYDDSIRMLEILNPPAKEKGTSFNPGIDKEHKLFGYIYDRSWGKSASIIVWNPLDETAEARLNVSILNRLGADFHVWSFWDEKYLGIGANAVEREKLTPHNNLTLSLTPFDSGADTVLLIGTSFHISMGAAEVEDFIVTPSKVTVELNTGGAQSGSLYLHSKNALVAGDVINCSLDKVENVCDNVWKVSLSGRSRTDNQKVVLSVEL